MIRRFPRRHRFPRFIPAETRNENGTLMCICGKPGNSFTADPIGSKQMRGFCSDERCWEIFVLHTRRYPYFEKGRRIAAPIGIYGAGKGRLPE